VTNSPSVPGSAGPDEAVDVAIARCLNIDAPNSFFLFAGAGSGKTRSVVTALHHVLATYGARLRSHARQVGVITYTNAACDEIKRRIDFDPVVHVATIHSFVWDLIKGFDSDIRAWLDRSLRERIVELEEEQRKGRAGTKAATQRARSLESKARRLKALATIKRFVYSPTGLNRERDALNHAEVIKLGAHFLVDRPLMQQMLIARFPFLLIDESQDTSRVLMEALLEVERIHRGKFALGLFGDTMQRIYADGKPDLGRHLPDAWAKPSKVMNYRSPRRIVRLINKIRETVDGQQQEPAPDAEEGHARLFVYGHGVSDKLKVEALARAQMAEVTGDDEWKRDEAIKTLILEHHMAARRLGFAEMFVPLYQADGLHTSLLEGTLPAVRFFSDLVSPLVDAARRGDEFAVTALVRKHSPLLSAEALRAAGTDQSGQLVLAANAVRSFAALWDGACSPTLLQVLQSLAASGLLEAPESLALLVAPQDEGSIFDDEGEDASEVEAALRQFLNAPFEQIRRYSAYISRQTGFDTHQGVKGLEFPRVLVVMDDDEARGFSFSYEKLFGAKPRSEKDRENEQASIESGLDRTRRLLYVTCSRAEKSLALVARSAKPDLVGRFAVAQGWFSESEVVLLER
jgi:DNA helicase-2/ATP-dependent DNA helicase PcrA